MHNFLKLPVEKQLKILNAGMFMFAKYGYKNANTEDIASMAGISKGLLFYYFKNKQSYYLYLFDYCEALVKRSIDMKQMQAIDDFYEVMDYGAKRKVALLKQYPYCMEFVLRAWFGGQEKEFIEDRIKRIQNESYNQWFAHLDLSRFKEDVDPFKIYQMLTWMMEGYLYDSKLMEKPLDINEMMDEFHQWSEMFKKSTYKEEFQ